MEERVACAQRAPAQCTGVRGSVRARGGVYLFIGVERYMCTVKGAAWRAGNARTWAGSACQVRVVTFVREARRVAFGCCFIPKVPVVILAHARCCHPPN